MKPSIYDHLPKGTGVSVRVFYPKRGVWERLYPNSYGGEVHPFNGKFLTPTKQDFDLDYVRVWDSCTAIGERDILATYVTYFNSDTQNPLGTPEGQKKIRELDASHTSMSDGDIVIIGRTPYILTEIGFQMMDFEVA